MIVQSVVEFGEEITRCVVLIKFKLIMIELLHFVEFNGVSLFVGAEVILVISVVDLVLETMARVREVILSQVDALPPFFGGHQDLTLSLKIRRLLQRPGLESLALPPLGDLISTLTFDIPQFLLICQARLITWTDSDPQIRGVF